MAADNTAGNTTSSTSSMTSNFLRAVPATPFGPPNNPKMFLRRVIGTTDINGKGTKHEIERQVDPFVFLDEAVLAKGVRPPFGAHPHTGIVANSIMFIQDSMLWDNQHREKHESNKQGGKVKNGNYGPVKKGGVFQIHAGRGIVHDEGIIEEEDEKKVLKKDDNNDGESSEKQNQEEINHVLQLWFNPGMHLDTLELEAESNIVQPEDIPSDLEIGDLTARVLLGSYKGRTSPANLYHAKLYLLDCVYRYQTREQQLEAQEQLEQANSQPPQIEYVNMRDRNINTIDSGATSSAGAALMADAGQDTAFWQPGQPKDTVLDVAAKHNAWLYVLKDSDDSTSGLNLLVTKKVKVSETVGEDTVIKFKTMTEDVQCKKGEIVVFPESDRPWTLRVSCQCDQQSQDQSQQQESGQQVQQEQQYLKQHFVFGAGVPFKQPWVKLLGNDGALLGNDEDYVRAKMAEYEKDPDNFGC